LSTGSRKVFSANWTSRDGSRRPTPDKLNSQRRSAAPKAGRHREAADGRRGDPGPQGGGGCICALEFIGLRRRPLDRHGATRLAMTASRSDPFCHPDRIFFAPRCRVAVIGRSRGAATRRSRGPANLLSRFLDRKSELWHSVCRWTKGASYADGKRPFLASHGATEGIRLKGRGREICMRHEGLAPVRLPQSSKTGSGFFSGRNFLPSHRNDRLSYPRSSGSSPEAGSFCLRPRTARPFKSHKRAKNPRKRRQPFALLPVGARGLKRGTPPWRRLCQNLLRVITYHYCVITRIRLIQARRPIIASDGAAELQKRAPNAL
jgi:hypothetical protein